MIRIARLRARSRATGSGESGLTLTELIVAIGLFAVVATLIMTTVTTFSRTFTRDVAASANTNTSAIGMNELTRIIRSGTALPKPAVVANNPVFELADRENMILVSYVAANVSDLRPVRVQFRVDSSQRVLTETRWPAVVYSSAYPTYWKFDGVTPTSRVIARKIAPPTATENYLFTYYKIAANGTEEALTIPSGGITDKNVLSRIAVVRVTLKVQTDEAGRAEPVIITNRVGIPNLGIPRVGGI